MSVPSSLIPAIPEKYELRVEGPDDKGVFVALLRHLGATEGKVDVKIAGGIDELLNGLRVGLTQGSGVSRLGIVADADDASQNCWNRIQPILRSAGYTSVPSQPAASGVILTAASLPQVGVWIMPDNSLPGTLEHFAEMLIPANDVLWPVAQDTVKHVESLDQRFRVVDEMKAMIHTWLAWQKEPGQPIGLSITKLFLKPDSASAQPLLDWLRLMYDL